MIKIEILLRGTRACAYVDVLGPISIQPEDNPRACYLQTQAGSFTVLLSIHELATQVQEKREQVS